MTEQSNSTLIRIQIKQIHQSIHPNQKYENVPMLIKPVALKPSINIPVLNQSLPTIFGVFQPQQNIFPCWNPYHPTS